MTYAGILNIDKPSGWTSHDVVGKVRRLLGQKSVGHAGTLDPMATGVLLVCVGQATRVADYLMAGRKVYRATAELGRETATYDLDGATLATAAVPGLTDADLRAAFGRFAGAIEQTPPAYSAIKQAGIPAYRKARRGEAVALPSRRVTIHSIELLEWRSPYVTFDVTCDPGTYVRSLAHDLGTTLGCGGTLAKLTRLQSGSFRVEDAISLDALAEAAQSGQIMHCLHPLRAALSALTAVTIDAEAVSRLVHGQPIPCSTLPQTVDGYALQADGAVVAILTYNAADGQWWPRKVFVGNGEGASRMADPTHHAPHITQHA
jgi:tRNA pseudouridine55 synthase